MNATISPVAPTLDNSVYCHVVGFATIRATAGQMADVRRQPGTFRGEPFPLSLLKHADDQAVAGLTAVIGAIRQHRLDETDFADWGVVAAPCFVGRPAMAQALQRFATEGAWGVSPHLIPHHSLHSVSGTISQALKMQGPNFGVGGGPGAESEGVILAGSMLADPRLSGVWLVLSGFEPELIPADGSVSTTNGPTISEPVCEAVALALARKTLDGVGEGLTLRIGPDALAAGHDGDGAAPRPLFNLVALSHVLNHPATLPWRWRLLCGGSLDLTKD